MSVKFSAFVWHTLLITMVVCAFSPKPLFERLALMIGVVMVIALCGAIVAVRRRACRHTPRQA